MTFPEMTLITINLPTNLLKMIDQLRTERMLNRSACIRLLLQETLDSSTRSKSSEEGSDAKSGFIDYYKNRNLDSS